MKSWPKESVSMQERKSVASSGLKVRRLSGDDLKPVHWDQFYRFYLNTVDSKWAQAYLTEVIFLPFPTLRNSREGSAVAVGQTISCRYLLVKVLSKTAESLLLCRTSSSRWERSWQINACWSSPRKETLILH